MPLQATSGAASYDAFGGGVPVVPNYIEEVFQTWLFDGTSATQTITNGIDLSTKGGLVWIKNRNGTYFNTLFDTVRGTSKALYSNTTDAETGTSGVTAFNTTGFTLGAGANTNAAGYTYASWTFRKQPKFFDVVTYTGNGGTNLISHNLGSAPGCVIVKKTSGTSDWGMWHRGNGGSTDDTGLSLNTTGAAALPDVGIAASFTSTTWPAGFVYTSAGANMNDGGATYVAYLFAHNAGGFGLTGTDNVISCGSYTGNGASTGPTVTLGYEPQWLMVKASSSDPGYPSNRWTIIDNMRGWPSGPNANSQWLIANTSDSEQSGGGQVANMTSTGFTVGAERNDSGVTFIYIAIRRGPMKVPTSGTSVFAPLTYTGDGTSGRYISGAGFPPDLLIQTARSASENREFDDRLRGGGSTAMNALFSNSTSAEAANSGSVQLLNQDGFTVRSFGNGSSVTYIGECFRRAPSFFDEVCYTGNGGINNVQNHSLADSIGMLIIKRRDSTGNWSVFVKESGGNYSYWNSSGTGTGQGLNGTGAATGTNYSGYNSYLTSTTFNAAQIAGSNDINANGGTYVAYLFATCAGVSKCTSFTGTGTLQTIDCGFTAGSRFVLIKRTDSTGDWYVWDSSRGLSSSTDPYLLLNSTAAEVTSTNWVDTTSTGFQVTAASGNNVNINGASYIALAIA